MANAYLVVRIKGQADVPHWATTTMTLLRLDKKGRKSGYQKITSDDLKELGFNSIDELAKALADGTATLSKLKPLKPWFALAPPKHGFKRSTKRLYGQKGILGSNKELDTIVRRMI